MGGENSKIYQKLLIVDDEPDITLSFKMILENNGFKVDVYNDPVEALNSFTASSYDLLLLDIRMPKMDGFQLYEELRKKDENVKVIFITAFDINYQAMRKMYPHLKIESFVRKPVDSEHLISAVRSELEIR
ncbi:MAG TPA: response regulator [Nitrososphaeraceae archaeon]|jgi:two-component system catabolic regulation response regulator CreB/two-component system response regulator ChvI